MNSEKNLLARLEEESRVTKTRVKSVIEELKSSLVGQVDACVENGKDKAYWFTFGEQEYDTEERED